MNVGKVIEYSLSGIIVVAIVAVIVSKNSATPGVLQSFGAALSTILANIVAPVSQSSTTGTATATGTATSPSSLITAPTISLAPAGVTSNANPVESTTATSATH